MGETLETGSRVVDSLGVVLEVEMSGLWNADEAFFTLLRDKQVLGAIVSEVAGPDVASANGGETGKVLKGIIRDCLAGENGREKVEKWVPKWFLFPASSYTRPAASESDTDEAEVDEADEAETALDAVAEAAE